MENNLALELVDEYYPSRTSWSSTISETPLRILLLDDDPLFNKQLKKVAKRQGVAVNCQTEESSFFEQLYSSRFDIVVVDYFLGENRKGIDLAMDIEKVPVVLISESSRWAKEHAAWPYTVRAFLNKKRGIVNMLISIVDIAEKNKKW